MHQVDMHQLDLHVKILYIPKRVSGASTRFSYDEMVRYPKPLPPPT